MKALKIVKGIKDMIFAAFTLAVVFCPVLYSESAGHGIYGQLLEGEDYNACIVVC